MPVSLRRRVQRRLIFRLLVILHKPESPTDQRREIFGRRFPFVEELLNLRFKLRLLIGRVENFEDFHRQ